MFSSTQICHGRYRRYRTNRYIQNARAGAFLSRLPITRIQRGLALEYVKKGQMKPWAYTKEQIIGATATMNFDYQPRPVRMLGTVFDIYGNQTSLKGGIKVVSKQDETNVMMWIPAANPKLKTEVSASANQFQHFLDERDKWDEAWMTGRARLK